jgi:hypothetical protein
VAVYAALGLESLRQSCLQHAKVHGAFALAWPIPRDTEWN